MFTLVNVNLLSFKLGHSYAGIGQINASGGPVAETSVGKLIVPWHELARDTDEIFHLLSWDARLSNFSGRDEEIRQLTDWATGGPAVRVKFVIGDGGVGKTRLGAEFAESMKNEGWSAGFVNLRKEYTFRLAKAGTLLVVDYPEEHVKQVSALLADLMFISPPSPLRVLLLTRESPDHWSEIIAGANASRIIESEPLELGAVDSDAATNIFNTAVFNAMEHGTAKPAVEQGKALITAEQMGEWREISDENKRALFVVAAAVHSAEDPESGKVEYSGGEIVKGLAKREVARLQRISKGHSLNDKHGLARILAIAAISGSLTLQQIKQIIDEGAVPLGFASGDDIQGELMTAGLWSDGNVEAPTPDILAAAFVVEVLGLRDDLGPETVWAALQFEISSGLERIGRLSYDSEVVLGIHDKRLSDWLTEAVSGNVERAQLLTTPFSEVTLPQGWLQASAAVWGTLADYAEDEGSRALSLSCLSTDLAALGDSDGALKAAEEAAEIYPRLAEAIPPLFEPNLADVLNNLSVCLSDKRDTEGALEAIEKTVEIYSRLAGANPARFEPDLADSLNNLSGCLSDKGDTDGALKAIEEAVEIRRRLADANPARCEPDLARSLNNLSGCLSDKGDNDGALEAIEEAVEIRRRLADANPARFEPDLASSLNNLSGCLSDKGDTDGALEAIEKAVEIYSRLTEANPARFEPGWATSLNNLSLRLSDKGDNDGALKAIEGAAEICRRLAEAIPSRFEPDLAQSLSVAGDMLRQVGKCDEATEAYREAIDLVRPYAEKWPESRFAALLRVTENDLRSLLES